MLAKTKEHQPNEVLSLRDNAKNQLLEIKTVEQAITYFNKLKTIDVWVKTLQEDTELQNIVAEQKIRTQRLLGELIPEARRKGILKDPINNLVQNSEVEDIDSGKTLEQVGITKDQSAACQVIASIPTKEFEDFLDKKKKAHKKASEELTTAAMLRFAKTLVSEENTNDQSQANTNIEIDRDKEIKDLAEYINQNFTKEQKAVLITLIYPH